MKINRITIISAASIALLCIAVMVGCKVKYSFTGASIPANAKTVSIAYFPNNSPLVNPSLSSTITQALQDKFMQQTKLDLVREDGDLSFEGAITNYVVSPASVNTNNQAEMNRLTITVKVTFKNRLDPQFDYTDKTFSEFEDYSATQDLSTAETTLIPQLTERLVENIFNAAVANW